MNKHTIIFAASLVIFVGLVLATVLRPGAGTGGGSGNDGASVAAPSQLVDVMEAGDKWILSVRLDNAGEDSYRSLIEIDVDGAVARDEAVLRRGASYSYVHHIYKNTVSAGDVKVRLTKSNAGSPIELEYKLKTGN